SDAFCRLSNCASHCGGTGSEFCRQKSTSRQNDTIPRRRALRALLVALAVLTAVRSLPAAEPNQLTPEQIADGWISLFDGETLFGWQATSDANWKAEDGAITVSEGAEGFFATTAEF